MTRTPALKSAIATFMSLVLTACAASPQQFSAEGTSMGDTRLCKTWLRASEGSDAAFHEAATAEINRRGLGLERCRELIVEQRVAIGAAILIAAAVVVAANSDGGGGGGSTANSTSANDYDWDWDQFQNQYGQRVTHCRGVQTGQFAENWRCSGKLQADLRWPGPYIQ